MAVEYNQHTWGYGEELTPDKLNNIEGGVKANADAINEVNNNLADALLSRTAPGGNATIGDSLKKYKNPGMYSIASQYVFNDDGDGTVIYGTLVVFAGKYNNFVAQLLFTIDNDFYYRQYIEGNWTDWKRI